MAGWVNTPCLKNLNGVFKKWVVDGNTIEFKLAWIDKSPIATYIPQGQTAAVSGELADLAIIRLHLNRQQLMQNGHMLLLQAKAARVVPPFVPSTNCTGQTPKEWKFMTSWPPFTLRTWAASKSNNGAYDVMQDVPQAKRVASMCEMNWFGVAPFYPKDKGEWGLPPYDKSPWWTTPLSIKQNAIFPWQTCCSRLQRRAQRSIRWMPPVPLEGNSRPRLRERLSPELVAFWVGRGLSWPTKSSTLRWQTVRPNNNTRTTQAG